MVKSPAVVPIPTLPVNLSVPPDRDWETVLDVDTGNLNLTGLGSGVYTIGEQVTLQTSLVDRIGESLTTVSSITNDSFVQSLKISILYEDRNLIYDGYKTNYTNPSFTFTKQENIDIFGSFTKNVPPDAET